MKVDKQVKFDDESDEEKKDEEDYNNEDHQAHMAKKDGTTEQSKPSRVVR